MTWPWKSRRKAPEPGPAPLGSLARASAAMAPMIDPNLDLDAMRDDPTVRAALAVKRHGVLAAPWRLEGDPAACDAVAALFDRMEGSPLTLLDAAMDAFARGMSVQELQWEEVDGGVTLAGARPLDPAAFGLELDARGRLTGLTHRSEEDGETRRWPLTHFAVWRYGANFDRPRGRSDLETVRPDWRRKRELLDAWARHLRRFGSPTLLGAYSDGLSQEVVDDTLRVLKNLPESDTLMHPDAIRVTPLGIERDSSTGFMDAIEFHDRQIARGILGQTLATDEGRRTGSLSLGKVHFQVMLLALSALRRELADVVMTEGVIRPFLLANHGPGGPSVRFVFDDPPLTAFATGET